VFCSLAVLDPRLATPWTYFLDLALFSVILTDSSTESPVHDLMLSIQAVRGLPRLRAPGKCIEVYRRLFHDLLLRSYLDRCVWSVITAHSLTPEKRDNNYSPHPLTPTPCLRNNIQLTTGILPYCGCLQCTL